MTMIYWSQTASVQGFLSSKSDHLFDGRADFTRGAALYSDPGTWDAALTRIPARVLQQCYNSATTGAKCNGSVMLTAHNAFFRASSPHALRIRMTPTQNSRHQSSMAWRSCFKDANFQTEDIRPICFPPPSCYRGWRNNNMMGVCPVRDAAIATSLWCSAICLLIAQSPVVQCIIASEGIRMCLFTSGDVYSYHQIPMHLDQDVFVQCSPHYVYSYHLTMTMMLSVSLHRCLSTAPLGMFTVTTWPWRHDGMTMTMTKMLSNVSLHRCLSTSPLGMFTVTTWHSGCIGDDDQEQE